LVKYYLLWQINEFFSNCATFCVDYLKMLRNFGENATFTQFFFEKKSAMALLKEYPDVMGDIAIFLH